MGVRVRGDIIGEDTLFPHARDWYVTDERVLQIYQEYNGDPEFVVAEYNSDAWEAVTYDPPLEFAPQPDNDDGRKGEVYDLS